MSEQESGYTLGEISALLAGIFRVEPEHIVKWALVVTYDNGTTQVVTDDDNVHNSPVAARAMNMHYLSYALTTMLQANRREEMEIDNQISDGTPEPNFYAADHPVRGHSPGCDGHHDGGTCGD